MREKIKITFPITPVEPDPPPFICDVCGAEEPYWLIKHSGKYKMCGMHIRKGNPIAYRDRHQFSHRDIVQLDAIYSIIGVIQNEQR